MVSDCDVTGRDDDENQLTALPTRPCIRDRVRVHWRDGKAYTGRVIDMRTELARRGPLDRYQVAYDDGDRRWHDEGAERVEVPRASAAPPPHTTTAPHSTIFNSHTPSHPRHPSAGFARG